MYVVDRGALDVAGVFENYNDACAYAESLMADAGVVLVEDDSNDGCVFTNDAGEDLLLVYRVDEIVMF